LGRIKTIPGKARPGSDIAIISILGYDPQRYYTGRGPLEAANLGVDLGPQDLALRCNFITVGEDKIVDYSAGHITSKEAKALIKVLDEKLGTDKIKFYSGVSYRNLLVIRDAQEELESVLCQPPHDIVDRPVTVNFPRGKGAHLLIELMQNSCPILQGHEINNIRIDLKENPANMIWLWGQGKRPQMPSFKEKYGLRGSVISAVDLIKGLGKILGLEVINVPGATGYYDTDYKAKALAALKVLKDKDFVFVHVEAPDEAGHNGDLREKITAIERFDQLILGTILEAFKNRQNYRILVLPDHATPISVRTHTSDEVFFAMFGRHILGEGFLGYSEREAKKSSLYFKRGYDLMDYFIRTQIGTDKR
jgi:2,3-bisphosphoglycerate-independent phosphoglycerate mutase